MASYVPAVGDIIEVTVVCQQAEQVALNKLHVRASQITVTGSPLTALALKLDTVFAPLYKGMMSSSAQYVGVGVQRIQPRPPLVLEFSKSFPGNGTHSAQLMPRQTCGLISLTTAKAGRAYRGRFYVPFPSEDSQGTAVDLPNAAYNTTLAALAVAWDGTTIDCTSGGTGTLYEPVIYHRPRLGPPPVGYSTDDIEDSIPRTKWATQRRRGDYGKPNTSPF